MLTRLRIQNFKAWADTRPLRLAPLTVYFGVNSSGKSSLNQFLLMLKQTAESADRHRVFHTGDETTPVTLGSLEDIFFRHDLEREIKFYLRWQSPLRVRDPKSGEAYVGDEVSFTGKVAARPRDRVRPLEVTSMRYAMLESGSKVLALGMAPDPNRPTRFKLFGENYRLIRNMGRKWELRPPLKFYGFPDEAVLYYQNTEYAADLTFSLERVLGGISYLGPLRELPRRIYTWSGDAPQHVGWRGERTIDAVLAARGRKISPGPHRQRQAFHIVIARWLKDLGLIDSFEIRALGRNDQVSEVFVRATGSREHVLLPDVGFGVSQLLPVLVQCFYAEPGSTIILEQPEIHLHPAVQSGLADLFIETIHAREDGKDRNVQVIVESHSEHFLRRLMRRVAEGVIEPEDVALYFCEPRPQGSIVRPLDVDPLGNIHNWPRNFFGDPMDDIAAQAELSLRRELTTD